MSGQGSKEFSSLLFTPRAGDKQGLPDYRTMPRPGRSTTPSTTQGYGRAKSQAEGNTPRRRSLTPIGSMKETTPPPPPSQSMLDSPAGPAAAPGTTVQPEPSGVSEQSGFWDPLKGRAGPPADDNVWVTVFGFQPGQLQLVMREFAKCGDIVHVGNGREDSANWVHIQYANKYGAQRALQRNGELVSRQLMVGVQPLEGRMRAAALSLTSQGEALSITAMPMAAVSRAHMQQQPLRPHHIQAPGMLQGPLPQVSRSTLSKVSEFVFGL